MKLSIHINDAIRLLENGSSHELMLWKISTGDILTYREAVCIGRHTRGGTHRVRLSVSGEIRKFRDVCLFAIDGADIYW